MLRGSSCRESAEPGAGHRVPGLCSQAAELVGPVGKFPSHREEPCRYGETQHMAQL